MLTYTLKKTPGMPLYESLYRCIREDILSGKLASGEKLPSKRALAVNLEVSKVTVEGAYNQLMAEGYIRSVEKVGYFVEALERVPPQTPPKLCPEPEKQETLLDLTGGSSRFPFSVWSKLQREVMLDYGEKLLLPLPNQGLLKLRQAIAAHLAGFRGLQADPEQILVGAGTDFLYNLLIQLLGRDMVYCVEEPGYGKIRKIYEANHVRCGWVGLDEKGIRPEGLQGVQVLHISPAHHFPTGLVTPLSRRRELLEWAYQAENRYIIEDDYDSEFRFDARPVATMKSMDRRGRVIYMNTFSRSLAPSIRISYCVLPEELTRRFRQELGFYSCTVPSFEQYTLARFLSRGYFEKHINRQRKFYRSMRNQLLAALESCPYAKKLTVLEQDAGLHFLVKVDTELSDEELVERCRRGGIRVNSLSSFYHDAIGEKEKHCLLVNYSGLSQDGMKILQERLKNL